MGILALTTNFVNVLSPKAYVKTESWSCPPRGFVKLNVDASFDHDLLRGTMERSLEMRDAGLLLERMRKLTFLRMC